MSLITRYLLRQVALAGLVATTLVTIVVWLTQIIRLLDLILDRGAPVGLLFWLLALTVPTFLGLIIPLALSAAVMFVYYRLLLESELVVLRAAGMSNWRLARPVLLLCLLSTLGAYGIACYGAPLAARELGRLEFIIKNDYAVALLRDGAFNKLGEGVTAYVREREGTSALRGILIYDASKPDESATLFAERGILQQGNEGTAGGTGETGGSDGRIILLNGTRQMKNLQTGRLSELKFEQYAVDLAQFSTVVTPGWRDPHERTVGELLLDDQTGGAPKGAAGKLQAELHQRIAAPLLAFGFPLLALSALLTAEVNRRGMVSRLAAGVLLVTAWQVLVLTGINLIPKHDSLVPFVYVLALGPIPFILWGPARTQLRLGPHQAAGTGLMGVLARYFGRQYALALGVVGSLLLSIVFLLDLAELFRRTATKASASVHIVFSMGLAKLPQTLEVVLPFVVLFAAIFALWRAARRQEIVIARAAGLSVWRIVGPLLGVALLLGLFNLTVFNPVAARLQSVYSRLVLKYISEGSTLDLSGGGLWLRQPLEGLAENGQGDLPKDGVAVIHGSKVKGIAPLTLSGDVMLLFFAPDGSYRGRLDATGGILEQGQWRFDGATLRMAAAPEQVLPSYRLPTGLTPGKIEESLAQPEELSFWQLPGFIQALDETGFSSVRHRTHYQALLAQPVLLLAMLLIAVVFMQRQLRQTQGLLLLTAAVGAGTALFILNNTVLAFGSAGTLPPVLAAWTLPLAACALAFGLLLHLEEGG